MGTTQKSSTSMVRMASTDRQARLAFTWEWGSLPIPGVEGPGNTLVTIEFVDKGKATAMILTQTGFSGEAARDAHEKGWNRCSDGIEQLLRAKQ